MEDYTLTHPDQSRQQQHPEEPQLEQQPAALSDALAAANALLLTSLSAGQAPCTDDNQLLQQIAAYRASIEGISRYLDPAAAAAAAAGGSAPDSSIDLQQQQQQQPRTEAIPPPSSSAAATAAEQGADEAATFAGLGEEGVDYTVGTVDELDPSEWHVPPHCIPIHANVTTFDWPSLYNVTTFDVIMMDPPWQLATANPTRGVALGYSQLSDQDICQLPVPQLQAEGGFLFVWVINSKYAFTLQLFDKWGYTLVDEIVWVKMTVNRRLAKSHGYYLQHAKEVCMVAVKTPSSSNAPLASGVSTAAAAAAAAGEGSSSAFAASAAAVAALRGQQDGGGVAALAGRGVGSDVIFSERRGQSQKPEEIYKVIEALVPGGRYLEIFARKNNLRNFWVSVGNEVTGTGLPEADVQALKQRNCIPGAVYGRGGAGASAAASGSTAAAAGVAGK